MGLTKILDTSSAYSPIDTYWWSHNDVNFNGWDKKQIVVKEKKWKKFIEDNFIALQKDYHFVNKKKPFEMEIFRGYSKIEGEETKLLISWNPTVITKGEMTINIHMYWDQSLTERAEAIVKEINKMMVYNVEKSSVYMVIQDDSGLDLRSFDINIPELDIELNYGKEWADKHDYLLKALSRENKKGIALLHGLPGTGKSMYIRYLISLLSENRTMIYLPNQLINSLTDPSFLPLMADYPNSILIIEDAEEAIKSRKQGGATVDKILNLSDGIISDFLGTQIICTFNSDITVIDEALLRKGRLILKHEFKKLDIQSAQKLADKLGKGIKVDKEMTVSEVYNVEELYSEDTKVTQKIGFGFGK
jgi:SpoVK/Ycf46/Vps4 family AAA+-type ATPase